MIRKSNNGSESDKLMKELISPLEVVEYLRSIGFKSHIAYKVNLNISLVNAALKALNLLKDEGILYTIPQSGFYVTDKEEAAIKPQNSVDFKSSSPEPRLFPYKDYQKSVNLSIEKNRSKLFDYSSEEGYIPLRKAITKLVTHDYILEENINISVIIDDTNCTMK